MIKQILLAVRWIGIMLLLALAGCLPDEHDPEKTSDVGKLGANYYASALGNIALKIQNSVTGDPSWFAATTSSQLNLAAMGIDPNTLAAPIVSHVCPTGSGTQVIQLTWIDGRDSSNKFSVKGVGTDTGIMMGALATRVSGEQLGKYDGTPNLPLSSGHTLSIPASCSGLNIPNGAPVLAFKIDKPAAPISQMSRTEYRTSSCGNDIRGTAMRVTKMESRTVNYSASGAITPSDPNAGWATQDMGNCTSDTIVAVNASSANTNASVALNNFADIAAQGLKSVLDAQLQMNCEEKDITSDSVVKNGDNNQTRQQATHNISTCQKATASTSGSTLSDATQTNIADARDVCSEKALPTKSTPCALTLPLAPWTRL